MPYGKFKVINKRSAFFDLTFEGDYFPSPTGYRNAVASIHTVATEEHVSMSFSSDDMQLIEVY